MATQADISHGDEFRAIHTSPHFDIGIGDDKHLPFAIVFKVDDSTGYDEIDQENEVSVRMAPLRLTDAAKKTLVESGCIDPEQLDDPVALAAAASDYGYYAPVTRSAENIDIGAELSFKKAVASDNYDVICQWIEDHGADMADAISVMPGFILDRAVNRAGETGWDQLGPHMVEGYSSETMWPRPSPPPDNEQSDLDAGIDL